MNGNGNKFNKIKDMKKLTRIAAVCLICSLIPAGCINVAAPTISPDEPGAGGGEPDIPDGGFELVASIGMMTRTTLDGLTLSWDENDVIKVWTGEEFTDYVHKGDGRFTGEKPAALRDGKYLALYPDAEVDGTAVSFSIPEEQAFALGKANGLPMAAVWGEGEKCKFTPLCSILEMPLSIAEGVTVSSITYKFNGAVGAGKYRYDWKTGEYTAVGDGDREIVLTGPFTSGNVYNAVLPGDYSGGFTLTITDTENGSMVLTATNGKILEAGKVQPLGEVEYELAPKFSIVYDDWAAAAELLSAYEKGTSQYWLSKTVNGEPLEGVAPVDMSSLSAGAKVKLYGYLCSENVATAGVKDGEKLYLVTKHEDGAKVCMRSVEYTYRPDPLEVVFYDDVLNSSRKYHTKLAGWGSTKDAAYTDDKAFGESCIRAELPQAFAELRLDIWDDELGTFVNLQPQAMALYNIEFYVKADRIIKGNTYTAIRYKVGSITGIMSKYQSAWQNYTHLPAETPIPANEWIKVSIPMNQIWLATRITTNDYDGIDVNEYQGYTDAGGRDGDLYSYKEVDRIYLNAQPRAYAADNNPTVFLIDHVTIRKCTLPGK